MAIKIIEESKDNRTQHSAFTAQHSVVLLDLSEDKRAADLWASKRFPGSTIKTLDKADLRRGSKREALARVRALKPDTAALFNSDFDLQSVRGAMFLFMALAGARRIV